MKTIKIGTRASKLAVIQAQIVQRYLENRGMDSELVRLTTTGDKILDKTLDKVGGKGLFVKELDSALLDGRSDISVHSLKDVPMQLPEGIPLLGFSKREDARDVLILPKNCNEIDFSKPIGCASSRRILQLKVIFPQAKFAPVRGNIQTRLAKLDRGEYSAEILALAGLKRAGLEHRISRIFDTEEILPAAGQGVLAVQGRANEDYSFLEDFFDGQSRDTSLCERAFVTALDGGCTSPTAAYAEIMPDNNIVLTGLFFNEEKNKVIKKKIYGCRKDAQMLGKQLAEEVRKA